MNLDDILLVAPAANIPNHFLESSYRVDLQDRTEIFGMVPAPHQQWLMEIKSTIPHQEHNAGR